MKPWSLHWLVLFALLAGSVFYLKKGLARQIAISLFGLACCFGAIGDAVSAGVLLVFCLSGYAICRILVLFESSRVRFWLAGAYLVGLIAAFLVLKGYSFLPSLVAPTVIAEYLSLVGLSYMFFRQIQVVVDTAEGQLDQLSIWDYLNFQFNAFTLLAGPIQRFQDFKSRWDDTDPILRTGPAIGSAAIRLFWGLMKVILLAEVMRRRVDLCRSLPLSVHSPHDVALFAVVFYGYPVFLYLNFSGYCDIVIAAASLVGMELPENFNRPYVARNMIDYWTRWHMSLTNWIRDYVFTPMYKLGASRGWAGTPYWSYFCFFVALFLAGVWHGSTSNYAVFGALHGFGIVCNKLWEQFLLSREGGRKAYKAYLASPGIRTVSIFLTINYACFAMFFFAEELGPRLGFLAQFLHTPAAAGF